MISLNQQIEEVEYEINMRIAVYARRIASGKMRRGEAEYHMDRMRAVLKTLHWLQDNERHIPDEVA